jgi:RimJ/RimL family protein N-acetyltransferase
VQEVLRSAPEPYRHPNPASWIAFSALYTESSAATFPEGSHSEALQRQVDLTDGVIALRPFNLADLLALYSATRESVDLLCAWMTWCRPDYSLEDCRSFLAQAAADWETGSKYNFAITDPQNRCLYGSITLNHLNRSHRSANVGYWVRQRQAGRGIASRALRLLIAEFGLRGLGLNRLEIVVPEGNLASQRVAQKAGAKFEGLLRRKLVLNGEAFDGVMYSLLPMDLRQ